MGATQKEAYPDQKMGDARLRLRKHLDPYQIALVVRELHHAVGILWKDAGDDGNFDIGVYQTSGDNEGTYDVSEDGLTRLIRSYDSAITIRGVYETIAVLRSVCPHVERCHDRDLIAVNNGVYDYGSKMLLGFDPEFVFTGKVRVDFVENAPNPVIHNDENDTGTFVDDAAALKSIITGDPFQLNRKFKEPRTVLFKGFVVQCVNELPRLRDRSESMYRRLLVVPFEKRFEGNERKYIKDDYLKRKEVLEYVLYHLLAETDYYELDEPQACTALLDEFREVNDPVRQFLGDVLPEASWDILSWQFVHDLYRHWFQRNIPSGRPESRKALIADIKRLLPEWHEWSYTDNPVFVPDEMRAQPEPLIAEYEVTEWMNKAYRGSDQGRVCMPDLPARVRGPMRTVPLGSGGSNETDSEDKED